MPQNALQATVAVSAAKVQAPLNLDTNGELRVEMGGISRVYNITAATVVKAMPGRAVCAMVIVAGSAAGTINDCVTTGAAAVGNQLAVLPNTVGPIVLEWPCLSGITVVPGTGQTVAISYV